MIFAKKHDGSLGRSVMIAAAIAGAATFVASVPASGQDYFEASGQTAAFTLQAGAKVGPSPVLRRTVSRTETGSDLRISALRNSLLVTLGSQRRAPVDIAVYSMAGRQVYLRRGFAGHAFCIDTRLMAPGIYNLSVRTDGLNFSRRFVVGR
jgi:hypothetical protein